MITFKEYCRKLNEQRVDEGPGAGYEVTLCGLKADKVVSVKMLDGGYAEAVMSLAPCDCEWSASAYYDSISSETYIDLTGDDDCTKVDSGEISGTVNLEEVESYFNTGAVSESQVREYLEKEVLPENVSVSLMYGGGWIHVNLGDTFTLELKGSNARGTIEYTERNSSYDGWGTWERLGVDVLKVTINSKTLGRAVDDYFANSEDYNDQMM